MGLFSAAKSTIDWKPIESEQEVDAIHIQSEEAPVLYFKHSTRCSISTMALARFEKNWNKETNCKLYFLDLLKFRSISNLLAEKYSITHQSPQAIVIFKGEVIYHDSHGTIDAQEIARIIDQTH